jgi:hypothetical protein
MAFQPPWVRCDAAENSFGHAVDASKLVHQYCRVVVLGVGHSRCPVHRGRVGGGATGSGDGAVHKAKRVATAISTSG